MKHRTIVVANITYEYAVGRTAVCFYEPFRRAVRLDELTGRTWGTIERGRWKGTSDGMVTPRDVEAYINRAV